MFFRLKNNPKNAGVAQSVEHLTRNEKVTCSSHATSSKENRILDDSVLFIL